MRLIVLALLCTAAFAVRDDDPRQELAKELVARMDSKQDPCNAFYEYACGGWLASHEIPADQFRLGTFDDLHNQNIDALHGILDEDWPVIGPFYSACMDTNNIETDSAKGLQMWLNKAMSDAPLEQIVSILHTIGASVLFNPSVQADAKNPDQYLLDLTQGGLGLPDRSYYLQESLADVKKAYSQHMSKMFQLIKVPTDKADQAAADVLKFETVLASISSDPDQLRDPFAVYNKMSVAALQTLSPSFKWLDYFKAASFRADLDINVEVPKFFAALSRLLAVTSRDTLKHYFVFQTMHTLSKLLPAAFVNETFDFYGKVLSGAQQQSPRWKQCVLATDAQLGEILGRYYVERNFPAAARDQAQDIINRVETAFKENLQKLDWMDDTTRAKALQKLSMVVNKIGYPDKWTDYSEVQITRHSYFMNSVGLAMWQFRKQASRIGQKTDRDLWEMTPPTVNAYYEPTQNQMVFPAGILRGIFFNSSAPIAMQFGAIGAVMGHELTHGFDDQGRLYDGTGTLTTWWDEQVSKAFDQRAGCIVNQYSQYTVGDSHVNGNLTLGENIADNGGVKSAFRAYKAKGDSEQQWVDFLTNEQLFFVAYGQVWCSKARPEYAQQAIKTDPHSPAKFRVIGPLSNLADFADVFKCPVGSVMNQPDKRCVVW